MMFLNNVQLMLLSVYLMHSILSYNPTKVILIDNLSGDRNLYDLQFLRYGFSRFFANFCYIRSDFFKKSKFKGTSCIVKRFIIILDPTKVLLTDILSGHRNLYEQ